MSNAVFQVGDELIVEKGLEGTVNGRLWTNTGKYWARGTNSKRRTSASRGTHKVFKSRQKEIEKAQKEAMKAEVNALANAMMASNFGTAVQYKRGPNGSLIKYNIPEYREYSPELKQRLAVMGIGNRRKAGPVGMIHANSNNENLTGMMGKMGIGKGGKPHRHTKRRHHSKRRHTRRN